MIWHPYPGQRVRVRYGRRTLALFAQLGKRLPPYQNAVGTVVRVGRGPGPINAEVRFENGAAAVLPRGNLFREELRT